MVGLEFDQFEHPLLLEDSTPKMRPTNTKEFKLWYINLKSLKDFEMKWKIFLNWKNCSSKEPFSLIDKDSYLAQLLPKSVPNA